MKLNKTTDYALRIIRTIYLEDSNIVTSNVISEKEHISQGVIMKILRILKDNDIIESHQGRGQNVGGFSLIAKLEELTLYDILIALEGPVDFVYLRDEHYNIIHGRDCSINKEFDRIGNKIKDEFMKKTLYEVLIEEQSN